MTKILVVDNYDSFVYTIVGYLNQLGADTVVVRNDAVPPLSDRAVYDGVLVSPGPVAVRVLISLVLAAAVLTACFVWVYPAIAPHMPFNQTTVGE